MGCGKSSIGRRLAYLSGHRFVDTDDLVAHKEGRAISEIFALGGEQSFRDVEQRILEEMVGVEAIVLATGGGAILREANRRLLHEIGIVVWLDAEPDVLFERATRGNRRPLLQTDDPRASFDALLTARREIYTDTADLRIDSTDFEHDEVARRVLSQAAEFHKPPPATT